MRDKSHFINQIGICENHNRPLLPTSQIVLPTLMSLGRQIYQMATGSHMIDEATRILSGVISTTPFSWEAIPREWRVNQPELLAQLPHNAVSGQPVTYRSVYRGPRYTVTQHSSTGTEAVP